MSLFGKIFLPPSAPSSDTEFTERRSRDQSHERKHFLPRMTRIWRIKAGMLLVVLLQRTPALYLAGAAGESRLVAPAAAILRGAVLATVSLGAMHAVAGATQFVINPPSPIAGTVGQAIAGVAFTYAGTPSSPASFRVTGSLPPGLTIAGLSGGIVNSGTPTISGTPTQAGSFSISVQGYNTPGATGLTNGVLVPITFNIAAGTTAPALTTHPAAQTVNVGATATFSAAASGTPAPTYQWRKDGTNLAGATAASLTLTNVQTANAGTYTVVAANSAGNATSNGALLTVSSPAVAPSITSQPAAQTVLAGAAVTFSAAASGTPAPAFQWRKDGTNLAGATAASLTLPSVLTPDAGTYTLVATNSAGVATSNGAALIVNVPSSLPTIFLQPAGQNVLVGASVSFAAGAFGTPAPTFQWRKNGADLPGATAVTLTLTNVQLADAGTYLLVASNSAGSAATNGASLTVAMATAAPVITAHPISQNVFAGQTVTFTVLADGNPAPTFQWRRNEVDLAGGTNSTLTLNNVPSALAGTYTAVATNSVGAATSRGATLTVAPPPATPIVTTPPTGQTVPAGQPVTFTAGVAGTPTPTLQWRRNGADLPGATNASLTIASVQAADAGTYTVVAANSSGTVTSAGAVLALAVVAPIDPGRLVNLSIRTTLAGGDDAFTVGTVIGGAGTTGVKPLLVRAVGPALAQFGVSELVEDPRLELFAGPTRIAANDNWGGESQLRTIFTQVGAFLFPSATSADAAVYDSTLSPGNKSVVISTARGAAGSVLVELYDATPAVALTAATPRLVNVSVLKDVGSDLTAGFVIGGTTRITVLIRAIGPTRTVFGVDRPLADPRLDLMVAGGGSLATNDDWGGSAALSEAFARVGAFPLGANSKDAAVLVGLRPGAYTVRASGAAETTGTALVEIYEVP